MLEHHPDRSADPKSPDIFISATSAYEVIGDAERRKHYDVTLNIDAARRLQAAQPKPQPAPAKVKPQGPASTIAADITRLTLVFSRGQHAEAEKLAHQIIKADSRQAISYAVLGDLARNRGNINEAAKMYAFAAQMDPRNPSYQQRYEELLSSNRMTVSSRRVTMEADDRQVLAPLGGFAVILLCCAYVVLMSHEAALAPAIGLVSSWTLGLVVMMFLAGVTVGASLSIGNLLDRFSMMTNNAVGRVGPALALATIAVVNFWAAGLMYLALGVTQKAFSFSTTRVVVGVAAATGMLALAAALNHSIAPSQVLLWGGNVVYMGSLCGWMVADSFKR